MDAELKKVPNCWDSSIYNEYFRFNVNPKTYLRQFTVRQLEKVEGLSNDRADIIIPALEVFVESFPNTMSTLFYV